MAGRPLRRKSKTTWHPQVDVCRCTSYCVDPCSCFDFVVNSWSQSCCELSQISLHGYLFRCRSCSCALHPCSRCGLYHRCGYSALLSMIVWCRPRYFWLHLLILEVDLDVDGLSLMTSVPMMCWNLQWNPPSRCYFCCLHFPQHFCFVPLWSDSGCWGHRQQCPQCEFLVEVLVVDNSNCPFTVGSPIRCCCFCWSFWWTILTSEVIADCDVLAMSSCRACSVAIVSIHQNAMASQHLPTCCIFSFQNLKYFQTIKTFITFKTFMTSKAFESFKVVSFSALQIPGKIKTTSNFQNWLKLFYPKLSQFEKFQFSEFSNISRQ